MDCKKVFEEFIKSTETKFHLKKVESFQSEKMDGHVKIYSDTEYIVDDEYIKCNNNMIKQLKQNAIKSNIKIDFSKYIINTNNKTTFLVKSFKFNKN